MTIAQTLDQLRTALPGCDLVAYGDLDARLVLASSASDKRPQEVLDALCLAAHGCLNGPAATRAAQALGQPRLDRATAFLKGRLTLFLRSDADAADALFCQFGAGADAEAALTPARETLRRLARLT